MDNTNHVKNIWCDNEFSETQKVIITQLTLSQFEKPIARRLSPEELVELVKYVN
jgi:hypothetical protein